MKIEIILISIFIVSGCVFTIDQPPPSAIEDWSNENMNIAQVGRDMELCGLRRDRNTNMSINDYLSASKCMERRGYYKIKGRRLCDIAHYKEYKACGGSRLD